jgi:hypothetical protein
MESQMPDRLMVGLQVLDLRIGVRIPVGQHQKRVGIAHSFLIVSEKEI